MATAARPALAPTTPRPGDRLEPIGFAIAILAHAALIWVLTRDREEDPPVEPPPMEVSFVEEVGPVSSAPEIAEAPAPSVGEEIGAPAEASGAIASIPAPAEPPAPEPIPQAPEAGERGRPDLTRSRVLTRPAPPPRVAQNQPRPQPRPTPQRQQQATPQRQQAAPGRGAAPRNTGFDAGRLQQSLNSGPPGSTGTSSGAPAQLTGAQRQQIARNISGLIAPCANRARAPNDFARSISVDLRVTVTASGTPTGHQLIGSSGTDSTNKDYVDDVVGVAMRAVRACASRIATLPADYYQTGWRTFRYRFRFP